MIVETFSISFRSKNQSFKKKEREGKRFKMSKKPTPPNEPLLSEQGVIAVTVVVILIVVIAVVLAVVITQAILKPGPIGSVSSGDGFSSAPATSITSSGPPSFTLANGGVYQIVNFNTGGAFALRAASFPVTGIERSCNSGGLIALSPTITIGDNFVFQSPTNSPFVLPADSYVLKDLSFGSGNSGIFATAATSSPNTVFQCSAPTVDVADIDFYYTFEKIQNIDSNSALFRIQSQNNSLYLRVCTEQTNVCLNALGTTASFTSGPPISADFTLGQANADTRGQWIITKVG